MLFTWWKKKTVTSLPSDAGSSGPTASEAVPVVEPPAVLELPQEKIAARAYEIWVLNGRPAGTGLQDWLRAEAELRAELAQEQPQLLPTQPR